MKLEFLSPLGGLLVLVIAVPLGALLFVERRVQGLREILGLERPEVRSRLPIVVCLIAIPALLAIALSQPVLRFTGAHSVRTDAEAFYVFDVSRSMSAAPTARGTRRIERAVDVAEQVHRRLASIPSGVATMTDRVLPSLFPTGNDEVFTASLEDGLTIGQPPPRGYDKVGTLFAAVDTLASGTFYSRTAKHRVAIVLTDGESRPFDVSELRQTLAAGPPVAFVIVRIWSSRDRVWIGDAPVADYSADPNSEQRTEDLARATGGEIFSPDDTDGIVDAVRRSVGSGPEVERGQLLRVVGLGQWLALAALLPLGYLLWRRNLG
jgi:hypothetical protein